MCLERWRSHLHEINPSQLPTAVLVLVEGSIEYVEKILRSTPKSWPVLAVVSAGSREKLDCGVKWTQLRHARVGGVTNFRVDVGFRECGSPPVRSALERTLQDIIGHSHAVRDCPPAGPKESHYVPTDRLSVGDISKPVLFPTHRSRTKWGFCALVANELAEA
ncbi:MAG: hypothetical protein SGILL_004401, partial [Bacillariaceae sp.]